jgi:hypothetical protein
MKRKALAALLLAPALWACASLLGIEELPVEALATDAGLDAADAAADVDAAPCEDKPALGCRGCPHAFCDDFDDEDAGVGERWVSPYTPAGGVLFRERADGGVRVVRVPGGISPPNALEVLVSGDGGNSYAALVHQLFRPEAPGAVLGMRLRIATRVKKVDVEGPTFPLPDGGALMVGIGPSKIGDSVVGFAVHAEGFYAVLGTKLFADNDPAGKPLLLYETEIASFGDQPFFVDIYVATRERALAVPLPACEAVQAPTVIAARINNLVGGCVPFDGELADLAWMADPLLLLGTGIAKAGTVHFVHDNVSVDFLQ